MEMNMNQNNYSSNEYNEGVKYGAKACYSIRHIKFIEDIKSDDWYEVWFNIGYKKFQTDNNGYFDEYVVGFNNSFTDPTLYTINNNEQYNDGYLLGCGHGYSNGYYPTACMNKSNDYKEGYEDGNDVGLYLSEREGRLNNNCQCKMFE